MKISTYRHRKRQHKAYKRILALLQQLVDQGDDRMKAKELTSVVQAKTTELGAAIPPPSPPVP